MIHLFLAMAAAYSMHTIVLPGASPSGIGMDYIASNGGSVFVPAGNTGAVDVIDVASGSIKQVTGFPTKEFTRDGRTRTVGPSSVTVGDGTIYVGNRADSTICAVDPKTLTRGHCEALVSMPDGVVYVAPTKEVWVTTPRDKSIRILDAATLHEKASFTLDGSPEGFAVDGKRDRFYTNLEDKDRTLAIDLKTHKTVSTWNPGCGEEGPRGLRVDESNGHLFVACTAKVEVLNAAQDGAVLSSIDTGEGVDDLDYVPKTHTIYAGAGRAGKLTVAKDDAAGHLSLVASVPTAPGARNAAVASNGAVYLTHGSASEIVVVSPK